MPHQLPDHPRRHRQPGRRITCDIVDAGLQLWGLPKLPLPLRASGGWLDFLYLDSVRDPNEQNAPFILIIDYKAAT